MTNQITFLRYPGGKQRQLPGFSEMLLARDEIPHRYIDPFVGGGSVFFYLNPKISIISDINADLIDLYMGIKDYPMKVWAVFEGFSPTKEAYYEIRNRHTENLDLSTRAARVLFLNRTCFKGMWRHNAEGKFNVGYGGQARRWVIDKDDLLEISKRLQNTQIMCKDFQFIIDSSTQGDFIFLDPPYCPGECDLFHAHYCYGKFTLEEQKRLADALERATCRGVLWAMTNSAHPKILALYKGKNISPLPKGTGSKIGHLTSSSGEVLIRNYEEVQRK